MFVPGFASLIAAFNSSMVLTVFALKPVLVESVVFCRCSIYYVGQGYYGYCRRRRICHRCFDEAGEWNQLRRYQAVMEQKIEYMSNPAQS